MYDQIDLESFVRHAGDAIIAVGANGDIILWNPAAERIFGFTPDEALGQSLDLIIPERFRERHWDGFRKVMLSGQTRYGAEVLRVPAIHKNGRPISMRSRSFSCLHPRQAGCDRAIVRDETRRWNEERELDADNRVGNSRADVTDRESMGSIIPIKAEASIWIFSLP